VVLFLGCFAFSDSFASNKKVDDSFSGFNRGFLLGKQNSSANPHLAASSALPSSSASVPSSASNAVVLKSPEPERKVQKEKGKAEVDLKRILESYKPSKGNPQTIWDDPRIVGREAREMLLAVFYSLFPKEVELCKSTRQCFAAFEADALHSRALPYLEEFKPYLDYLKLRTLFLSREIITMLGFQKKESELNQLFLILQGMDHQFLTSFWGNFQSKACLPGSPMEKRLSKVIKKGSNSEKGEFDIDPKELPQDPCFKDPSVLRYFKESGPNGRYRIYDATKATKLPNESSFLLYGWGNEIGGSYHMDDKSLPHGDGFILDKQGHLVTQRGIVFIHGAIFRDDTHVYSYERNPFMAGMFLSDKGMLAFKQQNAQKYFSPDISEFLSDLAGGMERIKKEKLVFVPMPEPEMDEKSSNDGVTVRDAQNILPYFYKLQEYAKGESETDEKDEKSGGENAKVDKAILALEHIIAEDAYTKVGRLLEDEIANELASKEVDEAVEKDEKETRNLLEQEADRIYKAYPQPEKKKSEDGGKKKRKPTEQEQKEVAAEKEKAKKQAIKKLKSEKAAALKISKAKPIQESAKAKMLEKIRTKYRAQAAEKKHFGSTAAQRILGNMQKEIMDQMALKETGETMRGSHGGKEVVSLETGKSVILPLVRRPEKEGFKDGTLKTIIEDHIERVLRILK